MTISKKKIFLIDGMALFYRAHYAMVYNQLTTSSNMFSMLKQSDTSNKTFTLEIYDGIDAIKKSYETLLEAII